MVGYLVTRIPSSQGGGTRNYKKGLFTLILVPITILISTTVVSGYSVVWNDLYSGVLSLGSPV